MEKILLDIFYWGICEQYTKTSRENSGKYIAKDKVFIVNRF